MWRGLLGEEHPNVATTLNNLASVLEAQGDYDAAESHYREALALHRRIYGEEHPGVATVLSNLASALEGRGDLVGAEQRHPRGAADAPGAAGGGAPQHRIIPEQLGGGPP